VSCLNDSTEIRYASKLLKDAFFSLQQEGSRASPEENALNERLIKALSEEPENPSHAPSAWFVTCFSGQRDDLTQWCHYSGGENGYAIGFLAKGFFGRGSLVVRVNYDEKEQRAAAAEIAKATFRFFREGIENKRAPSLETWTEEFLAHWAKVIGQLAPMVKNHAFKAENEVRIVHELQVNEMSQLRFRQKATLMSRHLPLVFPWAVSHTLPIVEVIVGPSRHKQITRISVDTLLRQKGYNNVPVSVSQSPYQMT
jgi:hypothetical protein